jgi:DNA-directed RNA polymerase specialized sigma24 family protein
MRLPKDTWEQIKAAYAAGIGLREIARNMNVPEGTVLARAKREGSSERMQSMQSRQCNQSRP